jgi:hypothetical protein
MVKRKKGRKINGENHGSRQQAHRWHGCYRWTRIYFYDKVLKGL